MLRDRIIWYCTISHKQWRYFEKAIRVRTNGISSGENIIKTRFFFFFFTQVNICKRSTEKNQKKKNTTNRNYYYRNNNNNACSRVYSPTTVERCVWWWIYFANPRTAGYGSNAYDCIRARAQIKNIFHRTSLRFTQQWSFQSA